MPRPHTFRERARQRRCTNRGRNFVRSKRRSTYTSSGTLYLFLRLNNSETFVELVGASPLHLLSQTVRSLKSPTGAFVAAQTRAFLGRWSRLIMQTTKNRKFPLGNSLLYISLSSVAFGRVRPQGRTLFLFHRGWVYIKPHHRNSL